MIKIYIFNADFKLSECKKCFEQTKTFNNANINTHPTTKTKIMYIKYKCIVQYVVDVDEVLFIHFDITELQF